MTTMEELYPGGRGYHNAHEPYIWAVVKALEDAGLVVGEWSAEPNDPRDGHIGLRGWPRSTSQSMRRSG